MVKSHRFVCGVIGISDACTYVCVLCVYICKLWHKAYAWFVYLRLQCTVTGAHMHELIWSCIRNKRGDDVMISVHHPILRTLSTTKRTTVRWHRPIVSVSIWFATKHALWRYKYIYIYPLREYRSRYSEWYALPWARVCAFAPVPNICISGSFQYRYRQRHGGACAVKHRII